jgi:peptidoglycan/LPS O-acetylase OafA/YrhL
MPAYLFYVLSIGFILSFTSMSLSLANWAKPLTYATALFAIERTPWYVAHTWSLSVEEHFYLVWPLLFVCLRRKYLFLLCIVYSFTAIIGRVVMVKFLHTRVDPDYFSPLRGDAIAVGCALALALSSRMRHRIVFGPRAANAAVLFGLIGLILIGSFRDGNSRWLIYFRNFGCRFSTEWIVAAVICALVCQPNHPLARAMKWRPLTWLGMLSYSIYLWQQPFLGPVQPIWMFKPPGNYLTVLIFAAASFYFIERPFLRLKSRLDLARRVELPLEERLQHA